MKQIFTLLTFAALLISTAGAFAAPNPKVRGTVKDANGESVGFCNVMFAPVADTLNVRGDITNAEGFFEMPVPAGEYRLTVAMLGYEPYRKIVTLSEDTHLGTIILNESAVKMDAAIVTADMIRRRADGYVFLPANTPVAMGRNTLELLAYAPGVWVDKDRGITINGKSGIKVMVNERMLNLSDDELTSYLESIDAEQIRSIEIIPDAGAQYDASASGGILKISLRRTMNGGLSGSVAMNVQVYDQDDLYPGRLGPTVNLEYRKDRLSLYTNFTYTDRKNLEIDHERTIYESADNRIIDGILRYDTDQSYYSARIGGMYELTDKQSVGIDFDIYTSKLDQDGSSIGTIQATDYLADGISYYTKRTNWDRYNVSMNYTLKTDEKGSNLTVVADYMNNKNDQFENNYATETPRTRALTESNRNTDRLSATDFYTLRADYKHYLNPKVQLEAGLKYAYTDMDTDIDYADKIGDNWVPVEEMNDHYLYREGVLAGYVNGTANLGRVNLVAGLRVENTDLRPHSFINPDKSKNQNYTDFFPSLHGIYFFNQEKGHLLNASYTRRIRRPGFSQLNPFRIQLNNYTYIVGNPDMKPSYTNSYSLTGIMANKYTLVLGVEDQKGAVAQIVSPEIDENGNETGILQYRHENVDRVTMYYASLTVPLNVAKWWRANVQAVVAHNENQLKNYNLNSTLFQGSLQNTFTFHKTWSAELSYMYLSGILQGNMELSSFDGLNLSLKKALFDNKLSVSLFVDNVLDNGKYFMSATISEPGEFTKQIDMRNTGNPTRRIGLTVRWNFKAGKDTRKVQKVVAGNEEERSRN